MDYVPPKLGADAFNCPYCEAYSQQAWTKMQYAWGPNTVRTYDGFAVGTCTKCGKLSIWHGDRMVYPHASGTPLPNPNMSPDILQDYEEARDIAAGSPRSACVLLRLCVEKIADELEPGGGDLNAKIGRMVAKGLPKDVSKMMDAVRVFGGEAAHKLDLDLRDDHGTATALFKLVNYVSDWAYTQKRVRDDIFDSLPGKKKAAIKKRDSGARRGA